jgi:hypothetical protein
MDLSCPKEGTTLEPKKKKQDRNTMQTGLDAGAGLCI